MQYYTDFDSYSAGLNTVVTLGKFESLHLGHQKLIKAVRKYAEDENLASVAVAFDMGQKSALTNEERREYLSDKVDCFIQCPFTRAVREMEAETFIEDILVKKLRASYIVVGTDFRFGYRVRGDVKMLKKYQQTYDYKVIVIEKEKYMGREISSTYVHEALEAGDIGLANRLLGYPYQMTGIVEHGKMLGRVFGFPTINIAPPPQKIMPRSGVYACRVNIAGVWYCAIGNVGTKPTVSDENRLLAELFLFGYNGNAYGKNVVVRFCAFRRPEIKFHSAQELKEQVDQDIAFGRKYFDSE